MATFTFSGTAVSVILVGDAQSGIVSIKIDKVSYPAINLFNNAAGATPDPIEYVIATNLPSGQHSLQVRVTGQNGYTYALSAKQVGIDGFRYGNFPFGTLRGRVLDPDGDGIPGARVSIVSGPESYNVQAGADGLFNLSGLRAGAYNVSASAENYTAQAINGVSVSSGGLTSDIDVTLPEAAGHTLFGRIYTPHSNSPAIQPAGTTLNVNIKTGSSATGWSASLSTVYTTLSLPIISASYDPITAWTLQVAIPAGTPAELYDLTVSSNLGSNTQVRAVRVMRQYDDPFYFVVLGDPQAATIEPKQPTFAKIVDEINLINPAFVLVVGDLTENGTASQYEAYLKAINRLRVPSYAVPGNHDFSNDIGTTGEIKTWALWKKYMGRRFYSFDYGSYHLAGLDNTIIHLIDPNLFDVGGYFSDQVAWAQADLASHQDSLLRFLFFHIVWQRSNGARLINWKPAWIGDQHTNMVLYGHAGEDGVEIIGQPPVYWVETDDIIEKGYRLVRINNGIIDSYTYNGSDKHFIPSGNLNLKFSPSNDGRQDTVTATLNNQLQEHFEHALLRFIMPRHSCFEVNKGVITQLVNSDDGRTSVVYVALDAPANSKTLVTVSPCPETDLTVTQTVWPALVTAGKSLTYTLTIINNGPSNVSGVILTDTLPVSVTFTSATPNNCTQSNGSLICNLNNLARGGRVQVVLRGTIDPAARGTLTNLATVAGSETDPNIANNTATQQTTVKGETDLLVAQTAWPALVTAGKSLTYTLTITNNGPSNVSGVILTATLPVSVTFTSATPNNCTQSNGSLICNLNNLARSDSTQVALRVLVDPSTRGMFTSTTTAGGNESDPKATNNSAAQAVTVKTEADLAITQTALPNPVVAGDNLTFRLTVANNGPSTATDVTLTNTLLTSLTFVLANPSNCQKIGNKVTCNLADLPPDHSAQNVTIRVVVDPTSKEAFTNLATATGIEPDPDITNNETQQEVTITKTYPTYLPLLLKQ